VLFPLLPDARSSAILHISRARMQFSIVAVCINLLIDRREDEEPMAVGGSKDFFISYNKEDRKWAEWIAWQLETAGYTTVVQAWDFLAGGNFVLQMDEATKQAKRTIAVLSPDYLTSLFTQPEWAAAFAGDPTGKQSKLLLVRVRECELEGLLKQIVYIDLLRLNELEARNKLLAGIRRSRAIPSSPPPFPGATSSSPATPSPAFPGSSWPLVQNVPYRRNPFFTGREQLLQDVHEQLCGTKAVALTQTLAIHGLGGIGKTQTAVEYAYRYKHQYQAIFWVRAAAVDTLNSDYVNIADLVQLDVKDDRDQLHILHVVKQWLSRQKDWLLILDNADDLELIPAYLPEGENGHILLTTRDPAVQGIARGIAVAQLDEQEGVELLLRRARGLMPETSLEKVSQEEQDAARSIVEALGGIPLAIDQAAAYIQQIQCGLTRYLELYQQHRADLLKWKRRVPSDYPYTVAATWGLAIEQVEQRNPAAAELLRLCAFLDPDAIPEDLLQAGSSELGPILQPLVEDDFLFNAAIDVLRSFSLIRRLVERNCLALHRLVQVVIKDRLDTPTQQQWAEQVVRVVDAAFPNVAFETWEQCQRYLPQVFACFDYINQYGIQAEAASSLLYLASWYLEDQGRYTEAEPLCLQSLEISEKTQGPEHPKTGTRLNNLANLYQAQGGYKEAEPLYEQALAISEKMQGAEHPETGTRLNNLAGLYQAVGRYEEAKPLYERALQISEKTQGLEHPKTGINLNNLANLYSDQGRYEEAEPLYERALAIREKILGLEHPDTAVTLDSLAYLYQEQGRAEEAELLYQRALVIYEKALPGNHPWIILVLEHYASLLEQMHRPDEAVQL
jgi:tetratricopeptide (TPR) repeat protein